MPPMNASGMLVRLPMTQAAMAATSSVKKSSESSCAKSGAMSTPARPARTLDRIHENERHPLGVDALELQRGGALDHGSHPQPEPRLAGT